jgi:hypothetical protein
LEGAVFAGKRARKICLSKLKAGLKDLAYLPKLPTVKDVEKYKYKDKRSASDFSTIQFRLIFKGHKSLEYWCFVIYLTSVSTISYAESNCVAFFSKYKAAHPNV